MTRLTALFAAVADIIRWRIVDLGDFSLDIDSDALLADLNHGRP